MAYADGRTPVAGDKVQRQQDGKTGTITHVNLNAGNLQGHDNVAFKPDDGSIGVGNSLGAEYVLLSRTANVDDMGHDLEWHKTYCSRCVELAPGNWDWCEIAKPLFVKEPL